jgi:hypothetical protein
MPMELCVEDGGLRARQTFGAPSVYLDHWAVCEFSDEHSLQDRFVKALHAKGGTFLLSHTNLAEFTTPSDARHATAAEGFLDRLLPNVYLTDFNLDEAEAFEANPAFAGKRLCPSPDLPMLKFLAARSLEAGGGITFQGFVALAHQNRAQIGKVFSEANANILAALNRQRADQKYVKVARESVPSAERTATRVVMGELMRDLTIDPIATITTNDIVDWQHAILSLLCCDFVLLDQKWEQRALSLQRRVSAQNLALPLAECFSKRNQGIARFLEKLEGFSVNQRLSGRGDR